MGRPPIPANVHKLLGTYRPDRHAGEPEIDAAPADAEPPAWLSADAAAEWRAVYPELVAAGVLKVTDLQMLAAYCSAAGDFQRCERATKRGMSYMSADGRRRPRPEMALKQVARQQMLSLSGQLGIGAVNRARVKAEPVEAEDDDPLAEFDTPRQTG